MATLVYRSLSGMAPAYLAAGCQLSFEERRRQLRSANSRTCVVRRTYSNFGDRCFATASPKCETAFQLVLRRGTSATNNLIKGLLKTYRPICLGVEITAHCE